MGEVLLGLRFIEREEPAGVFAEVAQVRCPMCSTWGDVDDDQLHGRVSTHHAVDEGGCGWHVTVDWASVFANAAHVVTGGRV